MIKLYSLLLLFCYLKVGAQIQGLNKSVDFSPPYYVYLDGIGYNKFIDKVNLVNIQNLIPVTGKTSRHVKAVVIKFSVKITIGNETRFYSCDSNQISDTLKKVFLSIKPLSSVDFNNVHVKTEGGAVEIAVPSRYEINSYEKYFRDYKSLLSYYLNETDSLSMYFAEYLDPDVTYFVESDCNFSANSCKTSLFFIIGNAKQLAMAYQHIDQNTERVLLYHDSKEIAAMNYVHGRLANTFYAKDPRSSAAIEGQFKITGFQFDTLSYFNGTSLNYENNVIKHEKIEKAGTWKYYNYSGKLINIINY